VDRIQFEQHVADALASIPRRFRDAVDNLTISLARELAPRRIRVNAIAPGGTRSEGVETAGMIGSDMERQIVANTPFGRLGEPEDIALAAVFLASEQSRWITGETIRVAGGLR